MIVDWDRAETEEELRPAIKASEIVRVGVADARLSLVAFMYQVGRDWHLRPHVVETRLDWSLVAQGWDARDEELAKPINAHSTASQRRSDGRGIPYSTIQSWVKNELRPEGWIEFSDGRPGRPRKGTTRFVAGPRLRAFGDGPAALDVALARYVRETLAASA